MSVENATGVGLDNLRTVFISLEVCPEIDLCLTSTPSHWVLASRTGSSCDTLLAINYKICYLLPVIHYKFARLIHKGCSSC